jgi:hypothetical protein
MIDAAEADMRTVRYPTRKCVVAHLAASLCVALILPACTKQAPDSQVNDAGAASEASAKHIAELQWAHAALQRNPTVDIVATDTAAGVFTIRDIDTGETHTVSVNELAAVPVSSLTAPVRTAAATPEATPAAMSQPEHPSASDAAAATTETQPAPTPSYTIERADGRVKVSGPGVSIVSTGTMVTPSEAAPGQRSSEPIICEGRRMLHLDNRNIYVDGNAIIARGGCELYITNSRITASNTGVVIGDAIVHIANSTIEGNAASFEAGDDAKVYLRSSTFQGLPRRAERALVQDQGGNQWR